MRRYVSALALLLLILLSFSNGGCDPKHDAVVKKTYYVSPSGSDSNRGSRTAPFKTIGRAALAVRAGDTVLVRTGTYHETIKMVRDGTPSAKITFKAYPGESPKLSGGGTKSNAVSFDGHDHIRFEGFEVTGYTSHVFNAGSDDNGGSVGIEIADNNIHDCGTWVPGDRSAGFYTKHGHDNSVIDNTITRISGYGVFVHSDGTVIRGNDISYPGIDNVYVSSQNRTLIEGNRLHHNVNPVIKDEHADLIQFAGAPSEPRPDSKTIIRNNVLVYGYMKGHYVTIENHGSVQIYNNLMYGGTRSGIFLKGAPNCRIFNNTILDTTYKALAVYRGSQDDAENPMPSSGAKIYNNIILNYDSLLYLGTGGGSGAGYEFSNNFTSGDPMFIDKANGNYRLKSGSPAIDRGYENMDNKLPYPSTDLGGGPRVVRDVIDIGAFEYGAARSQQGND